MTKRTAAEVAQRNARASDALEEERRSAPRVALSFPVRYRADTEPHQWHEGMVRDISAAGMSILTQTKSEIATHLLLLFRVPGEELPRQLKGLAIRTELLDGDKRTYLLGVRFTDMDESDREHIRKALRNADIIGLLREAAEANASDVHLSALHPILVRVAGNLRALRPEPMASLDLRQMIYTLLDERQRTAFERDLELNFSLSVDPIIRYRVNVHLQRGNVEAAFRRIEPAIRTITELHLPAVLEQFATLHDGLILLTGPTGAGKTTTAAAIVEQINRTRAAIVIALEKPIEYVFTYKQSIIKQREVGVDTHSFPIGLKEAMRQDPDVIVVGEVRDEETMKTALDAAETGHLVLATFPATDCVQSILRVVHFFRKERQQEVHLQLANCLRVIINQRLLPRADVIGVVPATEVLVNTQAVAHLIRTGTTEQIPSVIQTGMRLGMHSLESSLEKLFRQGWITVESVRAYAPMLEPLMRKIEAAVRPEAKAEKET